jgi:hypothetical protein
VTKARECKDEIKSIHLYKQLVLCNHSFADTCKNLIPSSPTSLRVRASRRFKFSSSRLVHRLNMQFSEKYEVRGEGLYSLGKKIDMVSMTLIGSLNTLNALISHFKQ